MFAGQEKSSFSMYNGINLLNSMTFSLKAYKRREICIHFTNWFFPKVFTGNEKCNFERTTETFWLKSRFFWLKMRKKLKQKCNFFSEFFFHRSVSWTPNNAILTNLLQWFRRKTKFYRLKAESDRKIVSFSRETMFCEKILWTRKRQFWRPFRYNFCCSPIFSVQSAKNEQKCTHFSKRIFHLNVSWTKKNAGLKALPKQFCSA